jgi:hypothetical protein
MTKNGQKNSAILGITINSILFALISLLNTYNENSSQLEITQLIRPLLICVFVIVILGFIGYFIWRSIPKVTIVLFISSVIFFSYGHIIVFLENSQLSELAKHRILFPAFLVVFLLLVFVVSKLKNAQISTINLNITKILSLFLVFNLAGLGYGMFSNFKDAENKEVSKLDLPDISPEQRAKLPDIYWIILDGYERKDALQDHYGYDNSSFLDGLAKRDFIIPQCSESNYTLTGLSLSTTLNMDYLENISKQRMVDKSKLEFRLFGDLIAKSKVRRILENYGYKTVAFKTGFSFTEIRDASIFIQPPGKSFIEDITHPVLEDLEEEFFGTTMVKIVFDMPTPIKKRIFSSVGNPSQTKYDLAMFNFDRLKDVPEIDGRKFVFAHFLTPHEPFVFNPDGTYTYYENTSEGYKNSLTATNTEILGIVDQIIAKSTTPPIIILQGDHAYSDNEKTKILNAYYLPGIDKDEVPENITPINTFRLILDHYLGLSYPLLKDTSFLSPNKQKPLDFVQADPSCY